MDAQNAVRLVVGGREYGGWKSVRIEAGIERQARSFDLEVTDRWPGASAALPRRIQPGDLAEVWIGADLVVTGYVDATPIKYDGHSYSVAMRGRSRTADLVDCCPTQTDLATTGGVGRWGDVIPPGGMARVIKPAAHKTAQWRRQKLEQIAADLAAPYGVRVLAEVDTGDPIPDHQIQQGETVFESIDRMLRLRHVLSTDDAQGNLVFIEVGSAGRAGTALTLGGNLLAASADLDYKGVFSEYVCKGQRSGDDEEYGAAVAEETATSTDARAKRYRLLVIRQSGQCDTGTCADRVEYERAHRAAKALQTVYTVAGWRQADGALWRPNLLVRVQDGLIGFDTELVIAEARWLLDANGMRTELTVGPVDGYVNKPQKKQRGHGTGHDGWPDVK